MSAAPKSTWELQPTDPATAAYRPADVDFGGGNGTGLLVDDATGPPPRTGTQFYADMPNSWVWGLIAASRMIPSARLTILTLNGGGGTDIEKLQTASQLLTAGDFAVTRNGVGDITIDWLSWKLPPLGCDPMVTLNDITVATLTVGAVVVAAPPAGHTQIRVRCFSSGVAVESRFTLSIH